MPNSSSDDDDGLGLPDRIREMCNEDATDDELIEVIAQSFRDAAEDSALKQLLFELADIDLQGALDAHERNIRDEIEAQAEARYEAELQRVKRDYESGATYDLIEERFLCEPQFRERVLKRIRRDLSECKELGKISPLFDRALAGCDQDDLVSLLLEQHKPELLERFRGDLVEKLLQEQGATLREEIKGQLLKNEEYMRSLKGELIDQVARSLFDDEYC